MKGGKQKHGGISEIRLGVERRTWGKMMIRAVFEKIKKKCWEW